tara:strand:+ start:2371 stop:2589 length:219 start_codon:yes stop_codon:yes gene_type:complete
MTKLEDAMAGMCTTTEDLETLLYKIGDSPTPATEDQLMNMLIGIIDMNKVRHERMWTEYNNMLKPITKGDDV